MQQFADVILPLPLDKRFTYAVTSAQASKLKPGMRVAVPFGKTKVYTGVVGKIHEEQPRLYKAKLVEEIMDESPLLTAQQMRFFKWMADYYMCSEGEVLKAALPSAFLLQSETVIELNPDQDAENQDITDEEYLILEALERQSILKTQEVSEILSKKTVLPVLNGMVKKGLIVVNQEIYKQYKPKLIRYVRLTESYQSDQKLKGLFDDLSNAPKQREVLLAYISINAKTKKPIRSKDLTKAADCTSSVVKALVKKGVLEEYQIQKDRITFEGEKSNLQLNLTLEQERAFGAIKRNFEKNLPCLLHGVTSSGKTEIYIQLIKDVLDQGRQVLYLVPEIALTTQLILRLQMYFGEDVLVYHSKYSVNERVEVYNHVLNKDKGKIVIGARSSIFLPYQDLGLIVVDESHETTFKQFDPAPRYNARDAAVVLSHIFKSNILLGTATPSLESYYNVKHHKYGLAKLHKRFGKVIPPRIELIDIKEKHRKKKMKGHFSDELITAITKTVEEAKQVILFQNRRGYSPILECQTCGHSPQCPNCDVSLTYHRHNNSLRCHYCGYHIAMQRKCMACESVDLTTKGFGTEQVETQLKELFPDFQIGRMDLDTTRGKYGYEKIITAFEQKDIDVLVGTQMLAKGLDFRDVDLVGVMNADNLLNFPDFRAHERAYQLLTQVSGRAGRTDKQGQVMIQTYSPKHAVLRHVVEGNYEAIYEEQMQTRHEFKYPPIYRLIKITLKGRNYNLVNEAADWLGKGLSNAFKENILGPEFPAIPRIRNEYYKVILLKIPPKQSLIKTKAYLKKVLKSYDSISAYRSVRVILNVDPY
ncbi:MAG TPA: primosomal protein N' [Flavobacteriaceae bacterium]|nr:primosomal protein N' [Flavobacteriaceae bacterium]